MQHLSAFRGSRGVALARETIDTLAQHDIPTSAANYEVWISHKSGAMPDLSRAIEARLCAGQPFTDDINQELSDRFFGNSRLSVQIAEASECIARELSDAVATIREAGEHSGSLTKVFDTAATDIEAGPDPTLLRSLVAELAATTREMAQRNLHLSKQMEESARRVEGLQATLENVRIEALTDSLTGIGQSPAF